MLPGGHSRLRVLWRQEGAREAVICSPYCGFCIKDKWRVGKQAEDGLVESFQAGGLGLPPGLVPGPGALGQVESNLKVRPPHHHQ